MDKFEMLQEKFSVDLGEFLKGIQTTHEVDVAVFERIDYEAAGFARILKGQALVPRSLLNELRTATKVLRAEAPYVDRERNALESMADKLEMTFDLILKGEGPEDRIPGVPRII